MAVNPITSEDLTIDLSSLLSLSVSERVQAAQDPSVAESLMSMLTPIQLAKAFPDYYRRELPDISNFILANRYLDSGGRFDQYGGGDYGDQKAGYGGEAVPDQTRPRLPGQQSEVQKSKVQQILEKARVFGTATGKTGVTSAIKDQKGRIISTADTSLSPAQRALLDTIAVGDPTKSQHYWESPDYNTIVGRGGKFSDFSDHPRVFGTATSTAAGRYQFTKTTWDDVVKKYNQKNPDNPITDFSPLNQDRAALFLAEERYRANTGRDLNADLANPPENMGELIKVGLGRGPHNLTWEIFTQKTSQETGDAFSANLARNQGYLEQEIEAEAKKKEGIEDQITATPELMESFKNDEIVQKFFVDNPQMANEVQKSINSGILTVDDVKTIVQGKKTDSAIIAALDKKIDVNTLEEGDPRKHYRNNAAVDGDDEIWKYLHPDLVRDKDRILASGKIRTGALLSADAVFRHAASQGVPMRVAIEGGADSHSANHLSGGVGESIDIKPGRRDANGRDIDGGNTWEAYNVNPAEYAAVSTAAIQSIGGIARTGISFNSSGLHTQDTGGEGLRRNEELGGMSWVYGQDLVGASRDGEWRKKLQRGDFGRELGGYVNSLYPESKKEENATTATATPAPPDSGKTMLISAGTNDWGNEDPEITYNNLKELAVQARAKGYTPVFIAPVGTGKFKTVNETANRVAAELGVKIEQPQEYDKDGYHPTQKEAKRIAGLYPGSVAVGDSIANRIGPYIKDGKTYATDSIQSGVVLNTLNTQVEEVKSYQFGGTPTLQDDEDLTAVDAEGKPKFKFNSGEGLYVKPEANEYADDKIDELSNRVDKMAESKSEKPEPKQRDMPIPNQQKSDPKWAEKVASAYRPSGTQQRAFNRAQFRSEGRHVGDRGSPNIA